LVTKTRTESGEIGKLVHVSRLTVFVKFAMPGLFVKDREALYDSFRARWIKHGMLWWSTRPEPVDYDPDEQLRQLWLIKWRANRD
jgi:hypothetical protein